MSAPEIGLFAFAGVLGLLVGSFLNVVIYRVPRMCLSIWRQTRSRCPHCGVQIRWFDNIPVLSWLGLRGRCFKCRARISLRYPLVELLTAGLFVLFAWADAERFGGARLALADETFWALWGVHALLGSALLALAVIDIDFRILPDVITLPGILMAPILVLAVPAVMPDLVWRPFEAGGMGIRLNALVNSLAGVIGGGGLLWGLGWLASKAFRKPAMGLGDVKLFAAMGGFLGAWLILALVLASFIGSVIGIGILVIKKDRYVPFGPFLAAGMVLCLLWGPDILQAIEMRLAPA
ncbi:MAG: prepilin peptidase [Planctomycetota bacterium]